MKCRTTNLCGIPAKARRMRGWSVSELVFVLASIFIILILGSMLLPPGGGGRCKAPRISCVNNLKQVGTAYRIWSGDNEDRYPWDVSTNAGGWKEYAFSKDAGRYCRINYAMMSNELGQTPRVLLCPADEKRHAASNFETGSFGNTNISFFVGINAGDGTPQSWLGGDRNLAPGDTPEEGYGYSPSDNLGNSVLFSTNSKTSKITWSQKLHSYSTNGAGNLLMGDNSVQQVSAARLRSDQLYAGVPIEPRTDSAPTNDSKAYSRFRLVFP
jgi:hypothetical protein